VITYEFLFGIPPFHDETPEKVFENILAGHIEWHDDYVDYSPEARDFMQRLMTLDPATRLGAHGADEVKSHPWFTGFDWANVTSNEAAFIPQVTDPESTDYFDPRGAIPQLFHDGDDQVALRNPGESPNMSPDPGLAASVAPIPNLEELAQHAGEDEKFGSFNFKNLPVLKQANDEVIKKMRTDSMLPLSHSLSEPVSAHNRRRSVSQRHKKPPSVVTSFDPKIMPAGPPSPATSTSSIASSPSRASIPPSTPGSAGSHARKHSEMNPVDRFRFNYAEGENIRRPNSMPSRLRTASISTSNSGDGSAGSSDIPGEVHTPPSSVTSLDLRPEVKHDQKPDTKKPAPVDLRKKPDPHDKAVTCLLAEDNPITAKIIETLLIRLGCRCVVVADGSEAISVAMGDISAYNHAYVILYGC
jgi:serine/threonine-protein kinase RIM15